MNTTRYDEYVNEFYEKLAKTSNLTEIKEIIFKDLGGYNPYASRERLHSIDYQSNHQQIITHLASQLASIPRWHKFKIWYKHFWNKKSVDTYFNYLLEIEQYTDHLPPERGFS